jgi:hypothetical protein
MPNALSIPEMSSSQAQKYDTFNMALKFLTALACGARDIITAYPGSPVENGCYIVGTGFGSHEINDVIFYLGGAWCEMDPVEGLTLWVWDENAVYEYTGSAWQKRTVATLPAGNWKAFYSNGSGAVTELALDNDGTVLRSSGAAAAPAFSVAILRLSSTAGVDLNQTASKTTLFTVPTGRTFVPTQVVVRSPSATAANAIVGFGGDASATDWASGIALTGLDGSTKAKIVQASGAFPVYAAGAAFGIKPTQAQGSAVTAVVDVFGYLY